VSIPSIGSADLLGLAAGGFVLATFSVRSFVALRTMAIASNLLFMGYAIQAHLVPILVLHGLLLPLNLLRLWQLVRPERAEAEPCAQAPRSEQVILAATRPSPVALIDERRAGRPFDSARGARRMSWSLAHASLGTALRQTAPSSALRMVRAAGLGQRGSAPSSGGASRSRVAITRLDLHPPAMGLSRLPNDERAKSQVSSIVIHRACGASNYKIEDRLDLALAFPAPGQAERSSPSRSSTLTGFSNAWSKAPLARATFVMPTCPVTAIRVGVRLPSALLMPRAALTPSMRGISTSSITASGSGVPQVAAASASLPSKASTM
jgi:hypothetical protein